MNERLLQIIEYRTHGNRTDFASLMGWSPQYLAKLLKGDSFGLRPVSAVLEKLPEIDARWLLLGTGSMFGDSKATARKIIRQKTEALICIEDSLAGMTDREAVKLANIINKINIPNYADGRQPKDN
ncbi:MAG: hypothetical protein II401_10420 [Bacteroidales bacterium]|nr:hypothetical protein [Bacteroidales bacterium]